QVIRQRLHAIECPVAADADQPLDMQSLQAIDDFGDRSAVAGINVVAGSANDGSAAGRVELGDGSEERIEAYVRNTRIEEAAEPLDEAEHFDAPFAGAEYGSVNRGVERGSIAPGCQDADAFHGLRYPGNSGIAGRTCQALQNPVQTQMR